MYLLIPFAIDRGWPPIRYSVRGRRQWIWMFFRRERGITSDQRPLSPELEAFLDAGDPPIYFGFGSMHVPSDLGQVVITAATPTSGSLIGALQHTLQPEFAARARSVAVLMRTDGADVAARRLIAL